MQLSKNQLADIKESEEHYACYQERHICIGRIGPGCNGCAYAETPYDPSVGIFSTEPIGCRRP